jgi:hypothetical protein
MLRRSKFVPAPAAADPDWATLIKTRFQIRENYELRLCDVANSR